MYKYTASAKLLETLNRKKGDARFWFLFSLAGSHYEVYSAIERWWSSVVFFSPKRLTHIPVGGYLLPAKLFDEEVVS